MIHHATGTATPITVLMVMYDFHDSVDVMLCFLCMMVSGIVSGYIGSLLFKNDPIHITEQIRRATGKAIELVA